MKEYKDCFWSMDGDILAIGNALIERKMRITGMGMQPLSFYDRRAGKMWARPEAECALIPTMFPEMRVSVSAEIRNHDGLSDEHLSVRVLWENAKGDQQERVFEVYPGIAMIHMRCRIRTEGTWSAQLAAQIDYSGAERGYAVKELSAPDAIDALPLPRGHYDLREIMLADKSDRNDTLLREQTVSLYTHGWGGDEAEGNLFIVSDRLDGQGVLLVKEAPAVMSMLGRTQKDFRVMGNRSVQLIGSGMDGQEADGEWICLYGSTTGVGKADELDREFRSLYRAMWHGQEHVRVLSNTWGDRNQDKAVCHDFMMKEIERAAGLGVQVVQIDDGWQSGRTANSALNKNGVWEGYYKHNPDFWLPDREKFPKGLEPLVKAAAEKGIELGLWFSPDSSEEFANWEKDAQVLLGFYRDMGVRRFKLDGVNLRSKRCERNYLRLLERLSKESGGRICANQDVTAQVRLGQIYYREYGNLFVENRYTDFGSYYPHNTLRNLWTLSRFIPAGKMQFECLNRGRNQDKYPEGDPFAPQRYTMDYLFAVTMAASPLIWMEMSHLSDADAAALGKIIFVYRAHQARMTEGDVIPVGSMPDGQSFTGFCIRVNEKEGYLLFFREAAEQDCFSYRIDELVGKRAEFELLAANVPEEDVEIRQEENGVKVRLGDMRTYAFVKYEVE